MFPRSIALGAVLWLGCWQPPDLPPPDPPPEPPTEAELLAARPYTVTVPDTYDEASQWPLLISLHGYGNTGNSTAQYLGLPELVQAQQWFFVAPNGTLDALHQRSWNPSVQHAPPWDVEYLVAVIHDVESKYRIDPKRVFVIGYSQGAHMAHRLACDAADDVSAVVAIAGQLKGCFPTQPVSALQIHGTFDEVIGYDGDVQRDPPNPQIPSAHETIAQWARADHCTNLTTTGTTYDLTTAIDGAETSVEAYAFCPDGIAVELWTMNEVGHKPPWTPDFATEVTKFFTGHPRP